MEDSAKEFYLFFEAILVLLIMLTIGLLVWRWFNPEEMPRPNPKEWCHNQGGKPVFVGYTNSWNCEFGVTK